MEYIDLIYITVLFKCLKIFSHLYTMADPGFDLKGRGLCQRGRGGVENH